MDDPGGGAREDQWGSEQGDRLCGEMNASAPRRATKTLADASVARDVDGAREGARDLPYLLDGGIGAPGVRAGRTKRRESERIRS